MNLADRRTRHTLADETRLHIPVRFQRAKCSCNQLSGRPFGAAGGGTGSRHGPPWWRVCGCRTSGGPLCGAEPIRWLSCRVGSDRPFAPVAVGKLFAAGLEAYPAWTTPIAMPSTAPMPQPCSHGSAQRRHPRLQRPSTGFDTPSAVTPCAESHVSSAPNSGLPSNTRAASGEVLRILVLGEFAKVITSASVWSLTFAAAWCTPANATGRR